MTNSVKFMQRTSLSLSAGDTVTSSYYSPSCSAVYGSQITLQHNLLIEK